MITSRWFGRNATLQGFFLGLFLAGMGMYVSVDLNAEEEAGKAAAGEAGSVPLRLILVRHAEAYRNLPNRKEQPHEKWDTLTPQGVLQADAVGMALKKEGTRVAAVLTAPTGRARQTAVGIMKALGLKGAPKEDAAVNACQAGESSKDKAARILGAIEGLVKKYPGQTVLIVTHQHLMLSALKHAASKEEKEEEKSLSCPPGSIAVVLVGKDAWKIEKQPELLEVAAKKEEK